MSDFYKISLYWFGIMWISWPLSHAVIVLVSLKVDGVPYGSGFLCVVLLASWASDVAGYYCKFLEEFYYFLFLIILNI